MGIKFEIYNDDSDKLIYYTHQGLGDLISCSSVVNYLTDTFPEKNIRYICQSRSHAENIEPLIRRKENVDLFVPKDWNDGKNTDDYCHRNYFTSMAISNNFSLILTSYSQKNENFPWDYSFYESIGLDYQVKYDHFHVDKNVLNNEESYRKLTNNEPYIFVHDDPSRGRVIRPDNKRNLRIVRNDMNYSIYDFVKIAQNAEECHLMGSSLLCLLDFFDLDYEKCKYHFYDFRGSNVNFRGKEKWVLAR